MFNWQRAKIIVNTGHGGGDKKDDGGEETKTFFGKRGHGGTVTTLKQKYMQYVFYLNRADVRRDEKKIKRALKAMKAIIKRAERQGVKKQDFLNRSDGKMNYGRTKAESPEEYERRIFRRKGSPYTEIKKR